MPNIGWAYISGAATPTAAGADTHIQFNSGSVLSGSSNFIYDYTNDKLILSGGLDVSGTITSYAFETITTTTYLGDTKFGNDTGDTHQFTGSVQISGGINALLIENGVLSSSAGATFGGPMVISNTLSVSGNVTLGNAATDVTTITSQLTASAGVSGSVFYGDGSNLTGVTGEWDGTHTGTSQFVGDMQVTGNVSISENLNVSGLITSFGGFANRATMPASQTISSGYNALLIGPITIDTGINYTIEQNANVKIKDINEF